MPDQADVVILGTGAAGLTVDPYYAVEIHASALGIKDGSQTDEDGVVLDREGRPTPDLYAVGNATAGQMDMVYRGVGGTLGPAMVFGYRAGRHAALHNG